jgi:hypothetical protein
MIIKGESRMIINRGQGNIWMIMKGESRMIINGGSWEGFG